MIRVGVVYLITESPEARGVLQAATVTRRKTYCTKKSLSMTERYEAKASGFAPDLRLKLGQDFEYRGETLCEYKGELYRIIRTYTDEKADGIELTLERVRGNASTETAPEPEPEEEPETGGATEQGSTASNEGAEGSGTDV